ncbi:MAG: N-acetyl-gamma-glutamyl-phosphate reductase [Pseudomonadota bacterium]
MKPTVYIDGQAGTTGLRIRELLADRQDVRLLTVDEAHRKDPSARRDKLLEADLAILCLPDDAAREATEWAGNGSTRLLDASTAHRVADGWVYGLAELARAQRDEIRAARFVANPGCYPTGVILLMRPLVEADLLPVDLPVSVHALSGYSGGGKGLIERWEDAESALNALPFEAPYAMDRVHKHIPEMLAYSGLSLEPQFVPSVAAFRCGMRIQIPLNAALLPSGVDAVRLHEALLQRYAREPFVRVKPSGGTVDEWTLDPRGCNDTNAIELSVVGHPSGHVLLCAVLDNLGKGASGAAVQNMNLMLGFDEQAGLAA